MLSYIFSMFNWLPVPLFMILTGLLAAFMVVVFITFATKLVEFIATIIDAIPFL